MPHHCPHIYVVTNICLSKHDYYNKSLLLFLGIGASFIIRSRVLYFFLRAHMIPLRIYRAPRYKHMTITIYTYELI